MAKRIPAAICVLALHIFLACRPAHAESITWIYSYEDALKAASAQNKPIMAGFYTTWCGWCRKLDETSYVDGAVVAASKEYVCLKVDAEKRRDVAGGYGVRTMPSILFLDPSGRVIWREFGYRDPSSLAGRMREVLSFYRKMAVAEPYIRSAFSEASRGKLEEAIAILDKGISLYPDDSRLYAARGLVYRYKGSADEALADIGKAIALNPKAGELYGMRAAIYYEKKEPDRALEDFDKAISFNKWSYEAYNGRGIIYLDRKDPDAAIKNFNSSLLINPRNPGVYYNRAVAYIFKGDLDKTVADLDAAIKLDPKFMNAYSARAGVLMRLGQYDKSWKDVYTVEKLGYKMKPEFLEELKRVSGRSK